MLLTGERRSLTLKKFSCCTKTKLNDGLFVEKVRDECLESIKCSIDEKEVELVGQLRKMKAELEILECIPPLIETDLNECSRDTDQETEGVC